MICEPSLTLMEMSRHGEIDLAIVTNCGEVPAEVVRQEPLFWVGSNSHCAEEEEVLPLALSKPPCIWRTAALDEAHLGRPQVPRPLHERQHRGDLGRDTGRIRPSPSFPSRRCGRACASSATWRACRSFSTCEIGIIRSWHRPASAIVDKLAEHIVSSLDNLSVAAIAA